MNKVTDPVLQGIRDELDSLDKQIVALLVKRHSVAANCLKWKHDNNLPLHAPEREWRITQRAIKLAHELDFHEDDFIRAIYWLMLANPFKKYYAHHYWVETA